MEEKPKTSSKSEDESLFPSADEIASQVFMPEIDEDAPERSDLVKQLERELNAAKKNRGGNFIKIQPDGSILIGSGELAHVLIEREYGRSNAYRGTPAVVTVAAGIVAAGTAAAAIVSPCIEVEYLRIHHVSILIRRIAYFYRALFLKLTMRRLVDIQIPLIHKGYLSSQALLRWLRQDVPVTLTVDAAMDFAFSPKDREWLEFLTPPSRSLDAVQRVTAIAMKRDRLRKTGSADYLFMADADVLLPPTALFGAMIAAFEGNPDLGSIGIPYLSSSYRHIGCGARMIRRSALAGMERIRGAALQCECNYITDYLGKNGFQSINFPKVKGRHLKKEYQEDEYRKWPSASLAAPHLQPLRADEVRELFLTHPNGFKLYIKHE